MNIITYKYYSFLSGLFTIKGLPLLAIFMLFYIPSHGQEINKHEFSQQLQNFVKFVEWPDRKTDNTFKIILYGDLEITEEYEPFFKDLMRGNQTIEITSTTHKDSVLHCSLLLILEHDNQKIADVINRVKELPILTVTTVSNFKDKNIIVNYHKESGNNIPFIIDSKALQKTGIYIDSILLTSLKTID